MKQRSHTFLLLLFTISVGRSHSYGHGVKGSFSNSYSSSSASASSSAFSNSFSSDPIDLNNALKSGSSAFATASANAGALANAGSAAYAGSSSGAYSGSGSGAYSNSGSLSGPGASISGAGSYSGAVSGAGAQNGATGLISGPAGNSGAVSGAGAQNGASGLISGPAGYSGAVSGAGAQNGASGLISGPAGHSGAISGAAAQNGASGLISGHAAHSGAVSGAGAQNGASGLISGPAGHSGAISGAGSNSGAVSGAGGYSNGQTAGSGIISGSPSSTGTLPGSGSGCSGIPGSYQGCGLPANQGSNSYADNNIRYNNIDNSPNNIQANDFQIPEGDSQNQNTNTGLPKHVFPGPTGSIYDSKPAPEGSGATPTWTHTQQQIPQVPLPQVPNYGASAGNVDQDSYKPGHCKSCKGPFPGPKGTIHDYVPAPAGGIPVPAPTKGIPDSPPLVRPSSGLFGKLPGPSGSIHDSKPAAPGGSIPVAVIPVIVGGGPYHHQEPQQPVTYHQDTPRPRPGSIAVSVSGKLPGPGGNIHSSVPVGQSTYKPQQTPQVVVTPSTYDKRPAPPTDLINSLPGKPGSIYDSKPIPGSGVIPGIDLSHTLSPPRNVPDCTRGQCDEYGGRLGCHGDDCFGPGKKPGYVHSGSQSKAQANSNSNQQSGNFNVDFNHPKPDCSKGQCNVGGAYHPQEQLPGKPGKTCSGAECLKHVPQPDQVKEHPKLDYDIEVRHPKPLEEDKPAYGTKEPKYPTGHQHSGSKADAHGTAGQTSSEQIPDVLPEVEFTHPPKESHPKESTTAPAPHKPSMDFLLPGNKPYHPHHPKPHHPKPLHDHHPKPVQENQPGQEPTNTYYTCTGTSCPLPKPHVQESTPTTPICTGTSCHLPNKGAGGKDRLVPPAFIPPGDYATELEKIDVTEAPKPVGKPDNQYSGSGSGTGVYTGAGGRDRLVPPPFIPPVDYEAPSEPERINFSVDQAPVNYGGKPGGQYSGSGANAGANSGSSNGYIAPSGISNVDQIPVNYGGKPEGQYSGSGANAEAHSGSSNGYIAPSGISNVDQTPVNYGAKPAGQYSGSGSGANAGANSGSSSGHIAPSSNGNLPVYGNNDQKPITGCSGKTCQLIPGLNSDGFVSGNVIVQKSEGEQVPVVDVFIPGNQKPGQLCEGEHCNLPTSENGGAYSGSHSGAYPGGQPCSGDKCGYPGHSGSSSGSSQGSSAGAYHGGAQSGSGSPSRGDLCGNGNCGHGINAVPFGGYSGSHSASFSGSSNHGGVKGGCKSCGQSPKDGGAYSGSGAFSGSSAYSGASSGAFGGSSAGSFSSAGSGAGPEASLGALKDLLTQSLKQTGFGPGFAGPEGFGGSGAFAKSGAVSGSGAGSSSAFSSAFSSAGSTSY